MNLKEQYKNFIIDALELQEGSLGTRRAVRVAAALNKRQDKFNSIKTSTLQQRTDARGAQHKLDADRVTTAERFGKPGRKSPEVRGLARIFKQVVSDKMSNKPHVDPDAHGGARVIAKNLLARDDARKSMLSGRASPPVKTPQATTLREGSLSLGRLRRLNIAFDKKQKRIDSVFGKRGGSLSDQTHPARKQPELAQSSDAHQLVDREMVMKKRDTYSRFTKKDRFNPNDSQESRAGRRLRQLALGGTKELRKAAQGGRGGEKDVRQNRNERADLLARMKVAPNFELGSKPKDEFKHLGPNPNLYKQYVTPRHSNPFVR